MDPVHLFVPAFRVEECLAEIRRRPSSSASLGRRSKIEQLEAAWKVYTGLPHARLLASASAGIPTALKLFQEHDGWRAGDEIITSPLTLISTAQVLRFENLTPIFADVDEYLCLDPASIESCRTPRTRAILYPGVAGNTGRLSRIVEIARRHRLRLILDASHMAGTRLNGRHVGQEADVVVFGSQAARTLSSAEGGMICFREARLDALLGSEGSGVRRQESGDRHSDSRLLRRAALGLVGLKYLDVDNAFRRQLCAWYDDLLTGVPGLDRVPLAPGCEAARHLYPILVDRRDEVLAGLQSRHIFPAVHYCARGHRAIDKDRCPRARQAGERLLSLPLHMRLRRQDIESVVQGLVAILGSVKSGGRVGLPDS
jgi:dTDP-4-amino-4,6-dideoxygalactose transaminase